MPRIHYDPLGPASSSPAVSGLSSLCRFPRKRSPSVLLRLRARVIRDHEPVSEPSLSILLLTSWAVSVCLSGDVPDSSSTSSAEELNPCPPDFVRRSPRRALLKALVRNGDSTPRRNESATTTLNPPESGESKGPGIILDIECLTAGVSGLSACGGAGLC